MTCASSLCEIRGIYHQANRRQPRALAAATGILQQPTVWNGAAPGVGSLLDHGDFPRSGSLVDRRSMAAVRILGIRIGDSDDAVCKFKLLRRTQLLVSLGAKLIPSMMKLTTLELLLFQLRRCIVVSVC